jgi:uncharacterized protein (DUF4415 family)
MKDPSQDKNSDQPSSSANNATVGHTIPKKARKVTVSLALDEAIVERVKQQATTLGQSFNTRVNAILEKYVNYFSIVEMERPAILTRSQHQFFMDEIDEEKYTNQLKRMGIQVINAMFIQTGMANTLNNFIKFVFEELCVNGGSIRTVRRYVSEGDGRTCLYFTHDYDLKWSRILSSAFAHHIQQTLGYHSIIQIFAEGFELKIIEKNPV